MQHNPPTEFQHPQGFLSLAKNVGIKDNTLDLTVIYSTVRARAATMFTRNRFPGARSTFPFSTRAPARRPPPENCFVATDTRTASTLCKGCFPIGNAGRRSSWKVSCQVGSAVIAGIAKGAGMIEPNMATMLVYLMTDAELPKAALPPMLGRVVDRTFNCLSIDTDTSTSDTVVLMANGLAGKVKLAQFEKGLLQVCEDLTKEIARSGEGATKLITVDVKGAKTATQAKRVAKSVVNSPLVKTAVYGCDPNWGRVIMAVGKTFDPSIEPAKVTIRFGDTNVFKKGSPVECDLETLRKYLGQSEVMITIELGIGKASARVWGCDLTEGYIKENAYYTT